MPTTELVRRFRGLRILAVGDVMLDSYFEDAVARLCAEGPVWWGREHCRKFEYFDP